MAGVERHAKVEYENPYRLMHTLAPQLVAVLGGWDLTEGNGSVEGGPTGLSCV